VDAVAHGRALPRERGAAAGEFAQVAGSRAGLLLVDIKADVP
jgi:hypothetical protein